MQDVCRQCQSIPSRGAARGASGAARGVRRGIWPVAQPGRAPEGRVVLLMPIRQMRRGSTGWYRCSAPSEAMLHPRSHTVHRQIGGGREPCLGWHDVLVLVQGPSNPHEEKGPHQLRGFVYRRIFSFFCVCTCTDLQASVPTRWRARVTRACRPRRPFDCSDVRGGLRREKRHTATSIEPAPFASA